MNQHIKPPNTAGWERDVAKHGARLLTELGYHFLLTLPHNHPDGKFSKIKGKAPGVMKRDGTWAPKSNWNDPSVKPSAVEAFAEIGRKTKFVPNLGILLGGSVEIGGDYAGYLTGIDIDTDDEHVVAMFGELFGYDNPIRRGKRGGTFLCITDASDSKDFTRKPGSEGFIEGDDENKIQFLRTGKQTVVLGVHPATLKRFQWEAVPMDGAPETCAIPPVAQLPIVSTAQLETILAKLCFERGSSTKEKSPEERSALSKRGKEIEADLDKTAPKDFEEVDEALGIMALLQTDAPLKRKLMRDHGDVQDHSTHDLQVCNMLRRHLGDKFDHHAARAVLAHFPSCSEVEKQTAHHVANIMAKAEQVKTFEERGRDAFSAPVVDESEDDEPDVSQEVKDTWETQALKRADRAERLRAEREADQSSSGKSPKSETWYENVTFVPVDLDINKLPPRPYIYNTYLQRGHVTLLSASGGVGKSAWCLFSSIDLACGVDHLDAGDFKRRKVLVYNAEDDNEEMLRRAGAYMLDHKFTDEMRRHVRENLTLISGVNGSMQLADYRDGRVLIRHNAIDLLKQLLTEREIEVLGLDPLVGLHTIPENANSEMNKLIMAIKEVTAECNVATLLTHHDKKNIGSRDVGDASQDDARGAGTITTPVRVVLSMKRLSKGDIKRLNVPPEDVPHIVSLSKGAKSNYSARDSGSRLFKMVSVYADNGSDEFKSDSTLSLRPYKIRAVGPQISDDERDAILAEIAKGEFRSDPQANGPLVAYFSEVIGVDSSDADWRKQVNGVLVEWLRLGWIVKQKARVKGHRREVPVYKLGPKKAPPAKVNFEAVEAEE
jgi:AAA domain-containing protein